MVFRNEPNSKLYYMVSLNEKSKCKVISTIPAKLFEKASLFGKSGGANVTFDPNFEVIIVPRQKKEGVSIWGSRYSKMHSSADNPTVVGE